MPPWLRHSSAPTCARWTGYTPGEQPLPGERVVKLNTNENPFPPSAKVMQAIQEIEPEMLRRYPNPTADAFRDAAAKLLGVLPDMIIAGNGSDDILTIATRTFVPPGGTLAFPDPTYSLYPVLAQLEDAKFVAGAVGARTGRCRSTHCVADQGRCDLPRQPQRAHAARSSRR